MRFPAPENALFHLSAVARCLTPALSLAALYSNSFISAPLLFCQSGLLPSCALPALSLINSCLLPRAPRRCGSGNDLGDPLAPFCSVSPGTSVGTNAASPAETREGTRVLIYAGVSFASCRETFIEIKEQRLNCLNQLWGGCLWREGGETKPLWLVARATTSC